MNKFNWDLWALNSWVTKADKKYARETCRKRGALKKALVKVLLLVHLGLDPVDMCFDDDDMQLVLMRNRKDLAAMHSNLHTC